MNVIELCERGLIPDFLTRFGMRRVIRRRLQQELAGTEQERQERFESMIEALKKSPIALSVAEANEQHYEVPAAFFVRALGARLKYSSSFFEHEHSTLAEAEECMLRLTCERAQLEDGERILELGCGWGSLTLWMAKEYPNASIVAVSNSSSQREFILERARACGFTNVQVVTADMNDFGTSQTFDRVVSVEMFEHMRNYEELLARIASWLDAKRNSVRTHILSRQVMYRSDVKDDSDWMARYFFTNGIMPAKHTLAQFQNNMRLEKSWDVSGLHYSRTSFAWLERQDAARSDILSIFEATYGKKQARIWFQRWRMFFMACGEFFATNVVKNGYVAHYLMRKR